MFSRRTNQGMKPSSFAAVINRCARLFVFLILCVLSGCTFADSAREIAVRSPDGRLDVRLQIRPEGICYVVLRDHEPLINCSRMGFALKGEGDLEADLSVVSEERSSSEETWYLPWGEVESVRSHYNELKVLLADASPTGRTLGIVFRVFNDGLGFRYFLPGKSVSEQIVVLQEFTQFNLARDLKAHWIPAYQNARYEYLFDESPVSQLDEVHTPLTLESETYVVSIHEAALLDYPSMVLEGTGSSTLEAQLVPWSDGKKAVATGSLLTPWRTIQIADKPHELINSRLILNLNEPSVIDDTSWIKPMRYIGIWWCMHLGECTWSPGEKLGATTERALEYIDFAADNGFDGVLVEGWNTGWDGDWVKNGSRFNFTESNPAFDIEIVTTHASNRGVAIIGHHETGASALNYDNQLESAFRHYQDFGIHAVKTGHVGPKLDEKEWHHGQYGVRHYQNIVDTAARHRITLNMHEPIKDTGLRRTYPHLMTREGARGQEFNAWAKDGGNPPSHTTILPFTRMLAGPMDFTPGIVELDLPSKPGNRVSTTLAKQLALYVVLYSPMQMAADLPRNYVGHPALEFLSSVPVDWSESTALDGQIGEFVTIARKDRGSDDWFVGTITNEESREIEIALTFLDPGTDYAATIYRDADDASWDINPSAFEIERVDDLTSKSVLTLRLAPGGGAAVQLRRQN